jgi:hypothetical protein
MCVLDVIEKLPQKAYNCNEQSMFCGKFHNFHQPFDDLLMSISTMKLELTQSR